ncbi:MAG: hypothetical protein WCV67_13300 [Victivallaceae bacterium]|jgi:hypothetical protein
MADNENKIVLNVPGQANVDPSEVTHDAVVLKDPLSGRDTDTGSLDRMDDTKTRKTVKIKPATGAAVPVISLGATAAAPRVAPAAPAAQVSTESTRLKDVLATRDTDTGNLDRMDDTKTRKTVKLSPITSGTGPVPVMKLGTVSTPAAGAVPVTTLPRPAAAAEDDTRTRQTVVLKTPPSPAINTESIPITTLPHPVSPADDDTRTRQTVVLKTPPSPAINTESIPITTLPHPVSPAEDDTRTRQTVTLKTHPSQAINTESIPITTLPHPVSPADDTRTRQTVVLKTPSAPSINTESIPITTLPHPVSPADDDTRTRQTVVLKTPSGPIPVAAVGTESAPLSDVLAGRDTDTGNLERMDDTKTKKTIKLTPLTAGGPISKLAPLGKPAGAPAPFVLPKPGSPPVNLAATVELKPVSAAPQPAAPPENLAATVELKPVVMPVPGQGAPVSTDTGSLKNILEDTSTRKTVKLQPLPPGGAAPAAIDLEKTVVNPTVPQAVAPDAEPMVKDTSDDTVKLQKTHVPTPPIPASTHETASPLPTVAQAKTVVPGAKQTIKLRPSTVSTPAEEPAAATAVKSAAGTSKDTIKISPLSTNGTPAAGVAPSAPTLNLAPKAPAPAPAAGVAPSSPTVNLSAPPSGLTLKKPALTPVPAPAAPAPEQKPGLSLPGRAPAVKPPEPAVEEEEPPVVEEAAMEEEEAVVEEKKGGLQLKKRDSGDEPQGPPRVQTDLEKIENSVTAAATSAAGQPSMLYFVLALASVICLAASTYITAAQYVNYWQQAKVKSKLPVPFLSQIVK